MTGRFAYLSVRAPAASRSISCTVSKTVIRCKRIEFRDSKIPMAFDRAYYRLTKRGPVDEELRALVLPRIEEARLLYVDPVPEVRPRVMTAGMLTKRTKALAHLREGAVLWVPGLARLGFSALDIRGVLDLLFDTGRRAGDAINGVILTADTPRLDVAALVEEAERTLKREAFGRARAEQAKHGAKLGRPSARSDADRRQAVKELLERDPRRTSAAEVASRWGVDKATIYAWARQMRPDLE